MKITSERQFRATPAELWQILHDPATMPAWNPKCIASESLEPWEVGQQFAVSYEMNRKATDALGELVAFDLERMVHFRYRYADSSRIGTVDEIFQIMPKGTDGTLLLHTVDFSNSALPRWVKWLIGFLGRFGKPQGTGPLDGIEALLPG